MKKMFSSLTENMTPQERNGFLIATLIAVAHFAAVPYYLYLSRTEGIFQLSLLAYISIALGVGFVAGAALIKRRQTTAGMLLVLGLMTVAYPPISAFLLSGLGLVLGIALAIVGPISAFQSLPQKPARLMAALTLTSGLVTVLLDIFGSDARPPLPGAFIQLLASAVVLSLGYLVIQRAWSGNIRVKLITSFTVIALISVAIVGTVTYISFRNQVREDIRQRLLSMVSIAALQQDGDLHATLQKYGDEQTDAYEQIKSTNFAIVSTDPKIAYLYTMRMNEQGDIYFVVDTGPEGSETQPLLDIYPDAGAKLVENFATMNSPVAEDDFYTDEDGTFFSAYAPFYRKDGTREGIIGLDISADRVIEQERAVLYQILGTTLVTMLLVILIGLFLGNLFVGPIINLSAVANKVAQGDLSARAKIETQDEIGELATDFNFMTSQLQETLQGLEQRVADRTRNLELAAEVGRAVSQVRELSAMLKDACDLILKEFNLYYVQVYLVTANGSTLKLAAGTGNVGSQLLGRGHSLPLNSGSINGRAAVEKRSVVIADTSQSPTFRPNQLLPETHGEMAVPLIVANKVVGVLDMQSNAPGVLTAEILPAFEALAGQLAVTIQNANLLEETNQARAEVEKQARRLVRKGWKEHFDAIHKPEQLGFIYEQDQISEWNENDKAVPPANTQAIGAPIAVTGEMLGSLVVEHEDEGRRQQISDLVYTVARQVSQQLENLRLLESAERFRATAEEASRRLTREGWQQYLETKSDLNLGYYYDLNHVRPVAGEDVAKESEALTVSLKIREEVIGKLAVQGLSNEDGESLNIALAVADRLSAHIENLRQFEATRRGQMELNKRATELQAVAEISTQASTATSIEDMLQNMVNLTKDKFGLYHTHIYLMNEEKTALVLTAGAGEIGRVMVAEKRTIPVESSRSLVARAARDLQGVISNDVTKESGHLPNPYLPETLSEMAVPIMVGDMVLGVFDIQSNTRNRFSEEDIAIMTTLSRQVAVALQNLHNFARAQQQAKRESMLNTINQKIQSATSVEAVLQIAARELGHALGAPMTIAQLSLKDTPVSS